MRRGLVAVSAVLLLVGTELATEGVTLVVGRLATGLDSLLEGIEFHVGPGRFVVGVVFMALGAVVLVLVAWSARAQAQVAVVGSTCPQCGNKTRRVKRKEWQRLLSAVLGERLTRRRCETCHWSGLSLRH